MTPSVTPLFESVIVSFLIVDTAMANIAPAIAPVNKCITIPSIKLR